MFDRRFFESSLGKAAIASVTAMAAFVALSSQNTANPAFVASASYETVEMA